MVYTTMLQKKEEAKLNLNTKRWGDIRITHKRGIVAWKLSK